MVGHRHGRALYQDHSVAHLDVPCRLVAFDLERKGGASLSSLIRVHEYRQKRKVGRGSGRDEILAPRRAEDGPHFVDGDRLAHGEELAFEFQRGLSGFGVGGAIDPVARAL